MIVNYGRNRAAAAIADGVALNDWRTFKFGTVGDPTSPTDTALKGAITGASITGTVVRTDNKLAYSGQWTNLTGQTQTVREFGLFDSTGHMIARLSTGDGAFTPLEVMDGQTLYVDTYDIYLKDVSEV